MKKFISYIAGVVTGMLLISLPIFADSYSKAIEALVNFTTVKINGAVVQSDNFVVDGKTYVWIRDVANMFGKEIIWDGTENTANIVDEGTYIAAKDDFDIVATVDGFGITKGAVNSASLMNPNGNTNDEILQNALEQEIKSTIAFNEALKNGFSVTDEVKAAAKSYVEQYRSYYKDQFVQILSSYKLTEEAFVGYIEKGMTMENFQKHLSNVTTFTDDELKAKYNEMIDNFQTATAKHILIKTEGRTDEEAKAEIEKIAKELTTVSKFDELMKKYSEDPGSKDKAEGMTFKKGEMVPEFEKAAFTQEIGVIGKPVKTQYGYHIILVTARSAEEFETVKQVCKQALFTEWYTKQLSEWKAAAKIEINDDILNSMKSE